MKKISVSSIVSLFVLSCSVPVANNSTQDTSSLSPQTTLLGGAGVGTLQPSLIKYNFAELEKEYKSFSTKALSDAYVKRMFGKYLGGSPNSVQLTRQLEFARYLKNNGDSTYETSLKNMFLQTPALYDTMTGPTAPDIQNKISTESATFGIFVTGISPYPEIPTGLSSGNINSSGFTANWTAVNGATSYEVVLDGGLPINVTGGTSLLVTDLSSQTTHTWKVRAKKNGVFGLFSSEISVTTSIAGLPVTTVAGGTAATPDGTFFAPRGIVTDDSGNIYVADTNNHLIKKITSTGVVSTFSDGSYNNPIGIVRDNTNNILYVADTYNHNIKKITSTGATSIIAGSNINAQGSTDATGTSAKFCYPHGITIDSTGANLYVTDTYNHRIRKIVISTKVVTTIAGNNTATVSYGTTDATGTSAKFSAPRGIGINNTNAILYIADYGNSRIRRIVISSGVVTTLAGNNTSTIISGPADGTGTSAQFYSPYGLAVNKNTGDLYVADYGGSTIRKVTTSGLVTTIAGDGTTNYLDGPGTSAKFSSPQGIAVENITGNIFIADTGNNRIRKIQAAP